LRVLFLDSNALARRYFDDMGSRVIRAIQDYVHDRAEESFMAYSSHAITEVESILNQLGSDRRFKAKLSPAVRDSIMKRLLKDAEDDLVIPHSPDIELLARQLIRSHDLRTLDAYHLAAAIQVHTTLKGNEQLTFVTSDKALLRAVDEMNIPNLASLDFITCVCRACGNAFHPPLEQMPRKKKQIRCPHCKSPIRCRQCYQDITKCKNTWMPDFLQPYAP